MPIHKNLSGSELHYPLGRSSEGGLLLEDNIAFAYQILVGTNNYFNIATTTNLEALTFGNAVDNPDYTFSGNGLVSTSGGHRFGSQVITGTGTGTEDMPAGAFILLIDTSGGSCTLNLPEPAANPLDAKRVYLIIDKGNDFGTNNLILDRSAGAGFEIDGSASNKILNDNGTRLWLFCDDQNYYTFLDGESQATGGGGGVGFTMDAKDANFTAVADYYYVCDTATNAAAITASLPNATSLASGTRIGFKAQHGASFTVTLDRSAGGNIDGAATNIVLNKDMAGIVLICDGTDYWIES